MKNIMLGMLFVFASTVSQFAKAEDSVWEYEGNKIKLVSFEKVTKMGFSMSDEYVIPKEYTQKGVYIRAIKSRVDYKNAAKIIKEQFAKNGIKVVDTLEDAGVAIAFNGIWGWSDLENADSDWAHDDLNGKRYYKEQTGRYYANIKLAPVKGNASSGLNMIETSIDDGEQKNNNDIVFQNLTPGIKSQLQLRMFVDYWIAAFVQKS